MVKDWLLLALAMVVLAGTARAQLAWSSAPSPTQETLNAVAFGAGQFVAVGEKGVILSSPDGRLWSPRISGSSVRLRGVTFGSGLFVAVGDEAMVLMSHDGQDWWSASATPSSGSPARFATVGAIEMRFLAVGDVGAFASSDFPPVTWSLSFDRIPPSAWRGMAEGLGQVVIVGSEGVRSSRANLEGFSLRSPVEVKELEAVAFGRGRFVAVGLAGATATSKDSVTWTSTNAGSPAHLRGVAVFNGLFVAVGDTGLVLTSPDGATWSPRPSVSTADLRSVAASSLTAVAVGAQGTLLVSSRADLPPSLVKPPEPVSEEIGGATYLSVDATGTEPLTYRWSFEGTPLAAASEPLLRFNELTASHTGNYTVTVTNAHGAVTSPPVRLTVLPAAGPAVVDPTFNPRAAVTRAPTAVLAFPGDRLLVAGGRPGQLVRLNGDGTIDPTFTPVTVSASVAEFATAEIDTLAVQPDGRILAGGRFSQVNGTEHRRLVRLLENGAVDPTFTSPAEIAGGPGVRDVAVGPQGALFVANGTSRIWRLLSSGAIDPTFSSREVPEAAGEPKLLFHTLAPAPDGKVLAGGSHTGASTHAGPVRFMTDGRVDLQLPLPAFDRTGGTLSPYETDALRVLADGRIMVASTRVHWDSRNPVPTFVQSCLRFLSTGAQDSSYQATFPTESADRLYWSRAWFYPDGRTLLACRFNSLHPTELLHDAIIRLAADGSHDPAIGGTAHQNVRTSARIRFQPIRHLLAVSSGRLVISGDLALYNDPSLPYLARLNEVAADGVRAPEEVLLTATPAEAAIGETVTYQVSARASGPLVYQWGGLFPRSDVRRPQFTAVYPSVPTLTVVNSRGSATPVAAVRLAPPLAAPQIVSQTSAVSTQSGREAVLEVKAATSLFVRTSYEWRRNGEFVAYTYGPLTLGAISAAQAGTYTVTVRDSFGNATVGQPIVVTVDGVSRFVNLSARAWVGPGGAAGPGEQGIFAGFVIPGPEKRRILLRGIGPALGSFGVGSPLRHASLSVYSPQGTPLHSNDGWDRVPPTAPAVVATAADFAAVGAFSLAPGSGDAALVLELEPGAYTASLTGQFDPVTQRSEVGVGLIEVYEYDLRADRLVNLSARVTVGISGEVAIPGLAVRGAVPKRLLVRAVGPGLAAFGVSSPLADPRLELRDETGRIIGENDDWSSQPGAAEVRQAAAAVGAFALTEGSKDAARLLTVTPGNYTVVVTGAPATTGIALVEAYEVP